VVMRSHIDLYVNDFSHDLGEMGEKAVAVFLARCGFEPSPY
jgi:predicted solute-binding protein